MEEPLCNKCNERPQVTRYQCRECIRATWRAWAAKNRHKTRAAGKRWRENNPTYAHENYLKNKEQHAAKNVQWRKNNPLTVTAASINSRARKQGHFEKLTKDDVRDVLAAGKCLDCGSTESLTVGHYIPLYYPSAKNERENLFCQCAKCNSSQSTRLHYSIYTPELAATLPFWEGRLSDGVRRARVHTQ